MRCREKKLLEPTVAFESSFGPLGAPNSTLEWEAQLKEQGTTILSMRFLISPKTKSVYQQLLIMLQTLT